MTERISFARAVAAVAILAIIATLLPVNASVQAAAIGISVDNLELTTSVNEQVNFVASVLSDGESEGADEDTTVSVSDNGGGGNFYTGTTGGACNADDDAVDIDNSFSIGKSKGICYLNGTPGEYEITVALLSSTSDLIGEEVTIDVSVEAAEVEVSEQDPQLLALIADLAAQVADLESQTGNTDPIPTPDEDDTNEDLQMIVIALQEQIVALQALVDEGDEVIDNEEAEKERLFGYLSAALFGIPAQLDLDVFEGDTKVGEVTVLFTDDRDDVESFEIEFTEAFKVANQLEALQAVAVEFEDPDVLFRFDFDLDTGLFLYLNYNSFDFNLFSSSAVLFDADFSGGDVDFQTVLAFTVASDEEEPVEETDENDGGSDGNDSSDAADKCEFEGHKYDAEGNPLEGWEMGLMKIITHDNGVDVYDISADVTDVDGFYCLRWSEERTIRGESTYVDGPYSFIYRVYEVKQTDWEFVSSEHGVDFTNLSVATADEINETDTQVQVQVVDENGFVFADAEYHVDFYNRYTGTTSTTTGGGDGGGGDNGSDDSFVPLTMVSVCRVTDGGMTFDVTNGNAVTIEATYEVVGTGDTATVTIAAAGMTSFTTATATVAGTTTLSYEVGISSYSISEVATSTDCDTIIITNPSGGGNGDDDNTEQLDGEGNGGSSSSGTRVGDRGGNGSNSSGVPLVAGISDSSPEPLVLGEQVSVVPLGGANTGAGGTAATSTSIVAMLLLAGLALVLQTRRFRNV